MPEAVDWDYGRMAQEACEALLEDMDYDDDEWVGPSGQPFCGCTTCLVREILTVACPILEEGIRKDQLEELKADGRLR